MMMNDVQLVQLCEKSDHNKTTHNVLCDSSLLTLLFLQLLVFCNYSYYSTPQRSCSCSSAALLDSIY
jgi:hypothetical protein